MSRDINRFETPELALTFQRKCKEAGHNVIFTSVDRDHKEQYAYFCQGREPLHIVNQFRRIAGLPPITQAENRRKITWTLNSKHIVNLDDERLDNNKSRAFDFAIVKDGKAIWDVKASLDDDSIPDYLESALIGESLGLVSGRHFKNPDICHLELPT